MNPSFYQTVPRKKDKTDALLADPFLRPFVPDTRRFSEGTLDEMLGIYDAVVFKPNIGGGGKNVGFVSRSGGQIRILLGDEHRVFDNTASASAFITGLSRKRSFILQRGIDLLTLGGRPVDIRVNVQKPQHVWMVTGIVAKAAAQGKRVTNRHSGGRGILLPFVLSRIGVHWPRARRLYSLLRQIGLKGAYLLNERYAGIRELGFDIGVDKQLRPYILEINTRPQFGVFRQAGDMLMLRRIELSHAQIMASVDGVKREL